VAKVTRNKSSLAVAIEDSRHNVVGLQTNYKNRHITINCTKEKDSKMHFPFVWLRDNCRCPHCFHESVKSRRTLVDQLDLDISPQKATVSSDANAVQIEWSDGHNSSFPIDFLYKHRFTESGKQDRKRLLNRNIYPSKLWPDNYKVEKMNYNEISTRDGLLRCLEVLSRDGLVFMDNVGSEFKAIDALADPISYLSNNNYGQYIPIINKFGPSNLACTTQKLGLHIDLPFYEKPPGVQFLHCIKQSDELIDGGENQFTDGFKCAEILRSQYPREFKILTTTQVTLNDYGTDALKDFYIVAKHPIIELDENGDIKGINYNNGNRDSMLDVSLQEVYPFYEALKQFDDILLDNKIEIKMNSGQMVLCDNRRVLHGRSAYTPKGEVTRELVVGYLEWDEINSRIRRIHEEMGINKNPGVV